MSPAESAEPVLQIVRGEPAPEELAALIAVVAARAAAAPPPALLHKDVWRDRSRHVRPLLYPGPGRWVTSNWPR